MKKLQTVFLSLLYIVCIISCKTAGPVRDFRETSLLPLRDGWYLYDFECLIKGTEAEYMFAMQSGGMQMIQELTQKQSGTVVRSENGTFADPLLLVRLTADNSGILPARKIPAFQDLSIRTDHFSGAGPLSRTDLPVM
ncbi:hypothetical protein K7I13_14320 [Brucepastera parasyntrophica]|uniref:hypothetical protein n=1 Tax=Brucepastera parasyntrophica TaxID=2880008 RepID=UPI002108F014|nr:hypothetical protein [Brucepastera parasyntrophica]ULQ59616.1 hypothetical protein K7I13_14320 [Brucepastera parasyntrophica]